MSDLREGLAKTLLDGQIVFTHERAAINLIDELVKVIRQHDGHAELVRAVRELAQKAHDLSPATTYVYLRMLMALCDAEMERAK